MSTRAELIAGWQTRLASAEGLLLCGSSRARWLWRMRAKVYRFLLACYGEENDTVETAGAAGVPAYSSCAPAPFVDHTDNLTGLQPNCTF